jgi:hypothetical protein
VPPNSGKRTVSPSFTDTGIKFPALSRAPGPTATTFPEFNYTPIGPIRTLRSTKKKKHTNTQRFTHCVIDRNYLGGFLWEKNTGGGFGGREDFLDQDTVEAWN